MRVKPLRRAKKKADDDAPVIPGWTRWDPPPAASAIHVPGFIVRTESGPEGPLAPVGTRKVTIFSSSGETMVTTAEKFAVAVKEFFDREF